MSRHCELVAGRTSDGYIVRVQGRGTASESPALAEFVRDCMQHSPKAVVFVDLLACDYLDSTFLGCLLNLQKLGSRTRFQVVADTEAQERLLSATHLQSYLELAESPPKTACEFVRIECRPLSQQELGRHMMESHQALAHVPSEAASAFGRIASELQRELKLHGIEDSNLEDTVVLPTQTKR